MNHAIKGCVLLVCSFVVMVVINIYVCSPVTSFVCDHSYLRGFASRAIMEYPIIDEVCRVNREFAREFANTSAISRDVAAMSRAGSKIMMNFIMLIANGIIAVRTLKIVGRISIVSADIIMHGGGIVDIARECTGFRENWVVYSRTLRYVERFEMLCNITYVAYVVIPNYYIAAIAAMMAFMVHTFKCGPIVMNRVRRKHVLAG